MKRGGSSRRATGPSRHDPRRLLLDRFTLDDVRRGERWGRQAAEFHWQYHSALARQRSRIKGSIREALLEAAEGPFRFEGWLRAVDYERSLEPLSARGSTTTPSGGRFNIGDIDDTLFPKFEALYLAAESDTALIEKFGATPEDAERHGLSMLELALRTPRSTSVVSIRGKVESVVDLRHPARLSSFVRVTSSLKIPPRLARWAGKLGFGPPTLVSTPTQLVENLMHPD